MEDNISMTQNTEFQQAFYLFDKNGDGTIPITELATVMRSLSQNPSYQEIESYIEQYDPDQNGVLSFPSFQAIMKHRFSSEDKETELNEAFKAFDPDNSKEGMIDIEEFREACNTLSDMLDEKQVDEICDELDTEKTGNFFYPELVRKIMSVKRLE